MTTLGRCGTDLPARYSGRLSPSAEDCDQRSLSTGHREERGPEGGGAGRRAETMGCSVPRPGLTPRCALLWGFRGRSRGPFSTTRVRRLWSRSRRTPFGIRESSESVTGPQLDLQRDEVGERRQSEGEPTGRESGGRPAHADERGDNHAGDPAQMENVPEATKSGAAHRDSLSYLQARREPQRSAIC